MSGVVVLAVDAGSVAERLGIAAGDEVLSVNGVVPRDIIEWQMAVDEAHVDLEIRRADEDMVISVSKRAGEPLGANVSSAVFDRVRTCDNHCEFCFIYQLPKGMRRSLYLKDDDYRLSFLYGNFTTLTRFTEADFERVITERLSPLNVSIHTTDPEVRVRMLKNARGGMSLRWLRLLLDHGIEIRAQIVLCPGVNNGEVFERTMVGVLDRYPEITSVAVVPLGISKFNTEPALRLHTTAEAAAMVDAVAEWQEIFADVLGRRMVYAADEYYLMADRPFPPAEHYEGFDMHEDGIGMARTFEMEFHGTSSTVTRPQAGFFAAVDTPALPPNPSAYTSLRRTPIALSRSRPAGHSDRPIGILTGEFGARILEPLVRSVGSSARVVTVRNEYFGGNTAVTGLMVGDDLVRVLSDQPDDHRYLLPDVCLNEDRFLDGLTVSDLPRHVEVIPTDGASLRRALEAA